MFFFAKPSERQIAEYLDRQRGEGFSYREVGCTREVPEAARGWQVDRERVKVGQGRAAFERAREAIIGWRMFPTAIATVQGAAAPREGLDVAVLYWAAPVRMWLLFPARVVYVIDDTIERDGGRWTRFGFAYGTLPDHPERGEERFLVEWDHTDDTVWYDLVAVSQPAHWLARLGYWYAKYEQARFRGESARAMQEAVGSFEREIV